MKMNEKVALITGAAKRVGASIAQALHAEHWRVIVHYGHSRDKAEALVADLNNQRADSACALQADLCDLAAIKLLAKAAKDRWGRVDALINNASCFYPTPLPTASIDQWNALFDCNARAPFFLAQQLLETLVAHQGAIINLVDIHAERPIKHHTIYAMSKAALIAMTKAFAKDLAPDVRVNGIAPGMMLWPDESSLSEQAREKFINRIPLKKIGDPADIAQAVLFLLSQSYITGQIIAIDGGRGLNI
jgi:pteridine reductase